MYITNEFIGDDMKKLKKNAYIPIIIILSIIAYAFFAKPTIEKRTWVLSYAQRAEPALFFVAHNVDYDFSNANFPLFESSKPIELTLEANKGKLILNDITNGNIYEGTYKVESWGKHIKQRYTVTIDGVEGTANISSEFGRTLFVSIGDYYLNFEVK